MRISDWSSDVCSSDLRLQPTPRAVAGHQHGVRSRQHHQADRHDGPGKEGVGGEHRDLRENLAEGVERSDEALFGVVAQVLGVAEDRKRVVWGTRVYVRVDYGCRRYIKQKRKKQ